MIPTIKPSRNPSTVHGVYSRVSLIHGRDCAAANWLEFGGRGRRLADPQGSSLPERGFPPGLPLPRQSCAAGSQVQ
jgi:hypothetical protein